MIIEKSAVRIAVELAGRAAGSSGSEIHTEGYSAYSADLPPTPEVSVSVEMLCRHGGKSSRGLVGGCFEAGEVGQASLRVFYEEAPLDTGWEARCPSELGPPLSAGLPRDFLSSVLEGLRAGVERVHLPPGRLTVDRAAYDGVDSSSRAFSRVSTLLIVAIQSVLSGKDLEITIGDAITRNV